MMLTGDPDRDFLRHDAEQEEWLKSRPVCVDCGEHIQDDCYYDFGNGPMCEDCMEEFIKSHRQWIED